MFAGKDCAFQIDCQREVQIIFFDFCDHAGADPADIVEQNVQPAIAFHTGFDHGAAIGFAGDIRLKD